MSKPKPTDLKALFSPDFINDMEKVLGTATDPEQLIEYIEAHKFNAMQLPALNSGILFYDGMPIGDRGNIVGITGLEKTRKTVIASAIASSIFKPDGYLGFTTILSPDEKVLHVDTEQGYRHYYESVLRIFNDAGIPANEIPDRFTSVHTRDADIDQRIDIVEYLLQQLKPAVLLIDGVIDFIFDMNQQREVTILGTKLLQWSTVYNLLIVAVIHTTKGTGRMTGSMGTYIAKKCQTAIETALDDKDDKITHVSCKLCRDEKFPPFSIEFSKERRQYVRIEESRIETKGRGGDLSPEGYLDDVHKAILTRVFLVSSRLSDHELTNKIKRFVKEATGDDLTAKKIKPWIVFYSEARAWIYKDPDNAWMRVESATSGDSTPKQANIDFDHLPRHDENATPPDQSTDDLPF